MATIALVGHCTRMVVPALSLKLPNWLRAAERHEPPAPATLWRP
jgi:hypothetical protein